MDLNELFFRHQIALMRVAESRSALERDCYTAEVGHFAHRITSIRRRLGARGATVLQELGL